MSKRATSLRYSGGDPVYGTSVAGVPARDLDDADIAALSDDQYRDATAPHPATGKPLYAEPGSKPSAPPKKDAEG